MPIASDKKTTQPPTKDIKKKTDTSSISKIIFIPLGKIDFGNNTNSDTTSTSTQKLSPDNFNDSDNDDSPETKCTGLYCDHDVSSQNIPPIPSRFHNLAPDSAYELTLQDLVDIAEGYHCQQQTHLANLSLKFLSDVRPALQKLLSVVGMTKIKQAFVEQIVYNMMDNTPNKTEMLHTIIEGPPGVGKSYVCEIFAEIYLQLGFLTSGHVVKAKLSDLKGRYIGDSPIKTQRVIDDAIGGVLIIDEVYSLGNAHHLDSFSKEIIDTINRNLTERAGEFVCIIAGYGQHIRECFLAHNPGLASRFRFRYTIEGYTHQELGEIFNLKVKASGWRAGWDSDFFRVHHKSFLNYGRDMESLLYHAKVAHANRMVWAKNRDLYGLITTSDLEAAFQKFLANGTTESQDNTALYTTMYL